MAPLSLLIVDDHDVVRRGLRAFFESRSEFALVGEASDALGATAIARAKQPDLALVDLLLPGENGVGACARIREMSPNTRCLMLTSASHRLPVVEAIDAGACGFVFKDIAAEELAGALLRVARGEMVLDARATEALRAGRLPKTYALLSAREQDVLKLIAQGYSNKEIADTLVIAEKTVKTHVGSILSKLELHGRTQVAVWVWRHGLAG
jgi:two-component system, NarL family, response regulator LiaR